MELSSDKSVHIMIWLCSGHVLHPQNQWLASSYLVAITVKPVFKAQPNDVLKGTCNAWTRTVMQGEFLWDIEVSIQDLFHCVVLAHKDWN